MRFIYKYFVKFLTRKKFIGWNFINRLRIKITDDIIKQYIFGWDIKMKKRKRNKKNEWIFKSNKNNKFELKI